MAPFDTNDFLTVWIPLQAVPSAEEGGSGLSFASASHRDFALPFWSGPNGRRWPPMAALWAPEGPDRWCLVLVRPPGHQPRGPLRRRGRWAGLALKGGFQK